MNPNNYLMICISSLCLAIGLSVGFVVGWRDSPAHELDFNMEFERVNDINIGNETLTKGKTSCVSDSMGLALGCKDIIYYRSVTNKTILYEGRIYTYHKDGKNIIHRLIRCMDKDCKEALFKGDNNLYADQPINRIQIDREVVMVQFG